MSNSKKFVIEGGKTYEVITYPNINAEEWRLNGCLHRENGPAYVTNTLTGNIKIWFKHDKKHRENGPAVEGMNLREWWIDGNPSAKVKTFSSNYKRGNLFKFFDNRFLIIDFKKVKDDKEKVFMFKFFNIKTKKIWRQFLIEE